VSLTACNRLAAVAVGIKRTMGPSGLGRWQKKVESGEEPTGVTSLRRGVRRCFATTARVHCIL
jgi:hypothetical protein